MSTQNTYITLDSGAAINGYCDPAFAAVKQAFTRNFTQHQEVGASVCLSVGGHTVVDLWGGHIDAAASTPWQENTVSLVYSCTKAATALCAHLLVDRGLLDLTAPIARYWPEFAQNGKQDATVLMALNHSLGLPALRAALKPGAYYDWDYMTERLAQEQPFWTPGTKNGYHMMTFGWTVGELVRRVSGKSLGTFFHDEIAGPLGLDFWIGLPVELEDRVAPIIPFVPQPGVPPTKFIVALMTDNTSISHLSLMNNGSHVPNSRRAHAAELGGGGGIANARALMRLFQPLAQPDGANHLLSTARIDAMRQVSVATECDQTLLIPTRFGQGFMLRMDNPELPVGSSLLIRNGAFGHVGMGGSLVFADPECQMSFGYTMNRLGGGILLNERGQGLVDAAYACLA